MNDQSPNSQFKASSFMQGHNAEYLEQYGVHLQTAKDVIAKYIAACNTMIEEGRPPNITHLYNFLDYCVEAFGNEFHHVLDHIGLSGIIRQDYLYRSQRDLGDIGKGHKRDNRDVNPKDKNDKPFTSEEENRWRQYAAD